jgi:putative endonuclease
MMPRSSSRPKNSRRVDAERGGQRAEALAALFLQLKFYRILDRRFKTPVGELDLVAERGGTIVFVEVKARRRAASEGETREAVNQRRIARAAQYWLTRHPTRAGSDFRFDVIFLAPRRWPRHVVNAFPAP